MANGSSIEIVIADKVTSVLPLAKLLAAKSNTIAIGRGVDSDIQVHHPSCSRVHCKIEWQGDEALVTDLRSTHGSSLLLPDGQLVHLLAGQPTALCSGATLKLGVSTRTYRFRNLENLQEELAAIALSSLPSLLESKLQLDKPAESISRGGKDADKENCHPAREHSAEAGDLQTSSKAYTESEELEEGEIELEEGEIPSDSRPCSAASSADVTELSQGVLGSTINETSSSGPQKCWVLVLDTCVLLDSECFVKLSKLVECGRPDCLSIVVPRIALRELDHLNHKPAMDARFRARQVFRLFENQKSHRPNPNAVLHFQGKDEPALNDKSFFEEHAREVAYRCNDDYILECAHHFHKEAEAAAAGGKPKSMVLITNDRALRVKARNIGLLANHGQEALQHMLRRCRLHKLLAEKSEASSGTTASYPITLDD